MFSTKNQNITDFIIAASIRISTTIVLIYCGPTTENYRRLSNRRRLETVIVNKVEEKLIAHFRLIQFFLNESHS